MDKRIVVLTMLIMVFLSSLVVAEGITVGVVVRGLTSDSNVIAAHALEKYATEKGWTINLVDCQDRNEVMPTKMRDMVAVGVDAIVVICGEASIIEEGVEAADKAGIPVFLEDTQNIGNTIMNSTSNGWAMGSLLASQAMDRIRTSNQAGGKVCIIGMPDLHVLRVREQMLQAVFTSPENPDIEVLDYEAINSATWQDESYQVARAWITKYGDEIDAIIGVFDGIAWGVSRAIADAGYTKEQIFTMGIDGSEQSYDLIRRGEPFVGTVAQNFAGWSKAIGDAITRIVINGEKAEHVIPKGKVIYVPFRFIDESNVPAKGQGVDFNYKGLE